MQRITELLSAGQAFTLPDMGEFLFNTIVLLVMSQILAYTYRRFGQTLSNRKKLSALFPILAITTMMIISIIKSSIALSLGLVGALSIVRFRSAIKEPEELAYIFLTITLGLGMGAGEPGLTLAFYLIIMAFIVGRAFFKGKVSLPGVKDEQQLYLQVRTQQDSFTLHKLTELLKQFVSGVILKRADETGAQKEYLLSIWLKDANAVTTLTETIKKKDSDAKVTLISQETDVDTL